MLLVVCCMPLFFFTELNAILSDGEYMLHIIYTLYIMYSIYLIYIIHIYKYIYIYT